MGRGVIAPTAPTVVGTTDAIGATDVWSKGATASFEFCSKGTVTASFEFSELRRAA